MEYDVIIVGGGIAGLTSAAYSSTYGLKTMLCEMNDKVGGLVNSFIYKGFVFDGGIRAIENSGIVFPMLKQLGIDMQFVKSSVSIVIYNKKFVITNKNSLTEYGEFLCELFPESKDDVKNIIVEIGKVMGYMDILYGIDNPLFSDNLRDIDYLRKIILPWFFKFFTTIGKVEKLDQPIYVYLRKFTCNQKLIDIIAQHFFNSTPAFFALSYFSLYTDYYYPVGGTGVISEKLAEFIEAKSGVIKTNCKIKSLNPEAHILTDQSGNNFSYKKLIWAADKKAMYNSITIDELRDTNTISVVKNNREFLDNKMGNDSILTVNMLLDIDVTILSHSMTERTFYTPILDGLSNDKLKKIKNQLCTGDGYTIDYLKILQWLEIYLQTTTYEISFPAMRDKNLAPKGKVGLIVSTVFDYEITKHINDIGYYKDFKMNCEKIVCRIITGQFLKKIPIKVMECFSSTPLTIERYTGNTHGAVTGWAFTNEPLPAVNRQKKVAKSVETPLKDIYQAGQWSFSPSGFPISVLTGKLAADKVKKSLKKRSKDRKST